ncbi:hypothetical protein [Sphingomonas sp. ID0503]|uniref:hypothetical protein n=1 Tax=Sphingomonas sp. ID0503 TaxID=3399691 RepID=UPI003AFB3C67
MIVVTVQLWPFGKEEEARTLAEARIANTSLNILENRYTAYVTEEAAPELGISGMDKKIHIQEQDRRQSVWALINRVIDEAMVSKASD